MNRFEGEIHKIVIQPLTPIHIGTGNEILPYEYVINGENFYRINTIEIYENLSESEKKAFTDTISKGMIEVRNWISKNYKENWGYIYKIPATEEFVKLYNSKIGGADKKNEENQLVVNEFTKSYDRFYIPGSAVKGAIRAAYVMEEKVDGFEYNLEKTKAKVPRIEIVFPNKKGDSDRFEKEILKYQDAKQDPFKAVKVSDLTPINLEMIVGEVRMFTYKKRDDDFVKAMPVYEEMTNGTLIKSGKETLFEGKFQIFTGYADKRSVNKRITTKDIIKTLNSKAKKMIEHEIKFIKKTYHDDTIEIYDEIESIFNSLSENEAVIRLGKGCGFESNTFYYNKKKGKNVEINSKKLVDKAYPMGWAVITFIEEGENFKVKTEELKIKGVSNIETGLENTTQKKEFTPKVIEKKEKTLKIISVDKEFFMLEEEKKVRVDDFMRGKDQNLRAGLKNLVGKYFKIEDSGKDVVKFIGMGIAPATVAQNVQLNINSEPKNSVKKEQVTEVKKKEKKIYTEKPTFEQYLSEKPDLANQPKKIQDESYNKFLQKHGFN